MELLPEGVATFLMTDIEGSTQLWDERPHAMADALVLHEQVVMKHVAANSGRFLKSRGEGDATLSVFARATSALDAALALQRALITQVWPGDLQLLTRIALHTGEAELREGDYFGGTLNRAARIRGLAVGGQVLCSRTTHDVVADVLPEDVSFAELGSRELRGLRRAETVFALVHPDLPAVVVRPVAAAPSQNARTPVPALVGRDEESMRLRGLLDRGGVGVVSGEAGIGKTALVRSLVAEADRRGQNVFWGDCFEGDDAPSYHPWMPILRGAISSGADVGSGAAQELARLVPDVLPGIVASDATDSGARFRAAEAVTALLAAAAPALVVLDDLHWADGSSLFLLERLAGAAAALRLTIVGTYRGTDVGDGHPLIATLGSLARADGFTSIPVGGLSTDAIGELARALGGSELDRSRVAAIAERCDGNPFFARQLVELADAGDVDGALPTGVRVVLGVRLSRLGSETREMLRAAAVVGREFDVDVVADMLETDSDAVGDAVDDAAASGLVEERGATFRFVHALVRETLDDELAPNRRRRLHRRAAIVLGEQPTTERPVEEIARHWAIGAGNGDSGRAVPDLVQAGERAVAHLAHDDAARWYRAALKLLDRDNGGPTDLRTRVLLGLADVLMVQSEMMAARDAYAAAADIAQGTGDDAAVVRAALGFHGPIARVLTVDPRERLLLDRALLMVDPATDSATAARLHARACLAAADATSGNEHAARAEALSRRDDTPIARYEVGAVKMMMGLSSVADLDSLSLATLALPIEHRLDFLVFAFTTAVALGDQPTARARQRELAELADEYCVVVSQAWAEVFAGVLAHTAGDLAATEAHVNMAVSLSVDEAIGYGWALLTMCVRRWQGRHQEAVDIIAAAIAVGLPDTVEVFGDALLAWALSENGTDDLAIGVADRVQIDRIIGMANTRDTYPDATIAMLADVCSRFDLRRRAADLIDALAVIPVPHVIAGPVYLGPLSLYRGVLKRLDGRLDDAVSDLEEALAFLDDVGARAFAARTRAELAHALLLRDAGADRTRASALLGEARVMAAATGTVFVEQLCDRVEATVNGGRGR